MILSFLLAAIGAGLFGLTMIRLEAEPEQLPFAYVLEYRLPDDPYYNYDLRVMDVLSGDILFEANSPEYDCAASLSPDGRWLIYGTSDNEQWNQDYTLVDLQSGEHTLLHDNENGVSVNHFRWDNEHLFFVVRAQNFFFGSSGEWHNVMSYNLNTGQSEVLANKTFDEIEFYHHQWIGDELITISGDDDEIFIEREDQQNLLLSKQHSSYGLALSSDGRYLMIGLRPNPDYVGTIINTQTGEDIRHTINSLSMPYWKPETHILTYLYLDNMILFYNADTQKTLPYKLANTQGGTVLLAFWSPWSPDGHYLAYKIYHEGEMYPKYDLYVLDSITGESIQIAEGIFYNHIFSWSGDMSWVDATHIIYVADLEASYEDDVMQTPKADIWLYDTVTGETKQLTDTPDLNEVLDCGFG